MDIVGLCTAKEKPPAKTGLAALPAVPKVAPEEPAPASQEPAVKAVSPAQPKMTATAKVLVVPKTNPPAAK